MPARNGAARASGAGAPAEARSVALIGVPTSAGARKSGQEHAPAALREAGLTDSLRAAGVDLEDRGDLVMASYRVDPDHPRERNLAPVLDVARHVAERVDQALGSGRMPLVVGGDCTVTLGAIAGVLRHWPKLGLLYFDGDADLNTPETTPSGIFDGMVLAHVLGRGVRSLAALGPSHPLIPEERVVLFGYDEHSGWIDPPELEALDRSTITRYPLGEVRADPCAVARRALQELRRKAPAFLAHFDVDVTNLTAADVPHPRGLDPDSAFAALKVFASSPACVGMVITELNPIQDPDGRQARIVAAGIAAVLGSSTHGHHE